MLYALINPNGIFIRTDFHRREKLSRNVENLVDVQLSIVHLPMSW